MVVSGLPLMRASISHRMVTSSSRETSALANTLRSAPPHHGALSQENLHSIFSSVMAIAIFCFSSPLNKSWIYLSASFNVLKLSVCTTDGFPRREMNRRNAAKKLWAVISDVGSKCIALVAMHVNKQRGHDLVQTSCVLLSAYNTSSQHAFDATSPFQYPKSFSKRCQSLFDSSMPLMLMFTLNDQVRDVVFVWQDNRIKFDCCKRPPTRITPNSSMKGGFGIRSTLHCEIGEFFK
ncbi:hypothetical protein T02_10651 [Trichinella nativa]|uniref:Uncharacterized protein n=1 Tax=Trichinella nativa TaxID=6335 RepID=A0A0V1KPJ4_9BILA|nr:hypothetical protein T02_10651 [Trichinella nativa]